MFDYLSYLEIPDKIGLGMVYIEAENENRITNPYSNYGQLSQIKYLF